MSSLEQAHSFVLVADEALQQYLYAIISARTAGSLSTTELKLFLTNYFEKSTKAIAPSSMPRCEDALNYMRQTFEAVDFFVEYLHLDLGESIRNSSKPTFNTQLNNNRQLSRREGKNPINLSSFVDVEISDAFVGRC
jgi:hypothetical protein